MRHDIYDLPPVVTERLPIGGNSTNPVANLKLALTCAHPGLDGTRQRERLHRALQQRHVAQLGDNPLSPGLHRVPLGGAVDPLLRAAAEPARGAGQPEAGHHRVAGLAQLDVGTHLALNRLSDREYFVGFTLRR